MKNSLKAATRQAVKPCLRSNPCGTPSTVIATLCAVVVAAFSASSAHAQWRRSFDAAVIAKELPPGCSPDRDVDYIEDSGVIRMLMSRDQITCREQVPEAVWPHPEVPKPRWPAFNRVPHGLDLSKGTGESIDPVATAYFNHLCKTEAISAYFREVKEEPPVSVINLRPRKDWQLYKSITLDRYYLLAPSMYPAYIDVLQPNYAGDKPFRGPRVETLVDSMLANKRLREEIYDREYDPATKKSTIWVNTDPPRQIKGWTAYEPVPGALTFVERPVVVDDPFRQKMSSDLGRPVPSLSGFKYVRVSYAPLGERRQIRVASGREFMFYKDPDVCEGTDASWTSFDPEGRTCWERLGPQRRIITAANKSEAKYGYVWREFFLSDHDLRLGIRGGDLMVVDMRTGEVIALSRQFVLMVPEKPHLPFRTSTWIRNSRYRCTGNPPTNEAIGIAVAVGAYTGFPNSKWPNGKPLYRAAPEPGDELVTR